MAITPDIFDIPFTVEMPSRHLPYLNLAMKLHRVLCTFIITVCPHRSGSGRRVGKRSQKAMSASLGRENTFLFSKMAEHLRGS